MSKLTPVVRAAALLPLIVWMEKNRKPLNRYLVDLELEYLSTDDLMTPVPLLGVVKLLNAITEDEGLDFPSRVIQDTPDLTLAMMGPFAMAARTPRDAFTNVTRMLPYFSSHEQFVLIPNETGGVVREFWAGGLDQLSLHNLSQWVAKLIELLLGFTNEPESKIELICITPHPKHGLDHLIGKFDAPLKPTSNVLAVHIPRATLDASFRVGAPIGQIPDLPPLDCLRGADVAQTARIVIRALLECGSPTLQDVAAASGYSVRSFQRALLTQNTSFRDLLGEVRRDTALEWMACDEQRLIEISEVLGYASPSSFTRSMRRWTGFAPSEIRENRKQDV